MKDGVIVAKQDATANINSVRMDLGDTILSSIQVKFTDGGSDLAGTLQLQASNDNDEATASWVDVASTTQAVANSEDHIYNINNAGYRYARFTWTYTSGTGNIEGIYVIKEPTNKRL